MVGAADNDVVSGAAVDHVIAEPAVDDVIALAEIDDIGDRRSRHREPGHGAIAVEILRDHGLRRLSHHGIAGAVVLIVEIPLPEFDAFQPTAALRSPDLEEGVVGICLLGGIGGAVGCPRARGDRGAIDAAVADLGHQDGFAELLRQRMEEIDRRFIFERGRIVRVDRYLAPGVDQVLNRWSIAGCQRRIGIHADGIDLIPEADLGGLIRRSRIGQFAVIDLANGRDQIGPVAAILLARQAAHLVADSEGLDAAGLRDPGEMHDFGLVGSKKAADIRRRQAGCRRSVQCRNRGLEHHRQSRGMRGLKARQQTCVALRLGGIGKDGVGGFTLGPDTSRQLDRVRAERSDGLKCLICRSA